MFDKLSMFLILNNQYPILQFLTNTFKLEGVVFKQNNYLNKRVVKTYASLKFKQIDSNYQYIYLAVGRRFNIDFYIL